MSRWTVRSRCLLIAVLLAACCDQFLQAQDQLQRLLQRFPEADANGDGQLTRQEADQYRRKLQGKQGGRQTGAPATFRVDPGWNQQQFPTHAVCYESPERIAAIYRQSTGGKGPAVTSYRKPDDDSLRLVATGHSFMAPGFRTFPVIAKAAGLQQPPMLTHTGGGITGSARYKWEQENGIFQFDRRPTPKLLASIANAEWDAMLWGPYYNDRPEFYICWMDFCLKYNPDMKFYLSDAWPQIDQLDSFPRSEEALDLKTLQRMGDEKRRAYAGLVEQLNQKHADKVFVLPTSDAMVLAAEHYFRGELPGVEGIHTLLGKKERSLWRDRIGHLGPGFEILEGYVFYATIYGKSPELIQDEIPLARSAEFPGPELDRVFRKIAWQAVTQHPLSGVMDRNLDGLNDSRNERSK